MMVVVMGALVAVCLSVTVAELFTLMFTYRYAAQFSITLPCLLKICPSVGLHDILFT